MRPLDNIKVLDLSRILAGPYCSMILADMGAEVIKIEIPQKGDDTRAYGPPFVHGESAYFLSVNRNKKSLTVNLKAEEGKEVIRKLIMKSDVLLENFRRDYFQSLGFDYQTVHQLNPKLIYCSITGYGHTGPMADSPGYDLAVQGMSGLMSLTGDSNGPPFKMGTSIADILAGIYATQGILLALVARHRTGKGQKVDISLLDGQVSLLTYQAGIYFLTDKSPTRKGNQHPTICPYETFATKDRYINIACGNDKLWIQFCNLFDLKDLVNNPKFATNPKRVENHDELFAILQPILKQKTSDEWLKLFDQNGIPAGPILNVEEILNHPQIKARDMVKELPHTKGMNVKVTGIPVKLSDTPGSINTAPPSLGQHTDEVLGDLGYSKEDIQKLKTNGVI